MAENYTVNTGVKLTADIKKKVKTDTGPFHYAIRFGHEEVASVLLASGANKNAEGFAGYSPITLGLAFNRGRIISELEHVKARWYAKRDMINRLLISKAALGQNQIVQYLLQKGADADALHMETTPLIVAARYADEEILQVLVRNGAEIEKTNATGTTPLISAAYWGNAVAVEWLLEAGANVRARDEYHHSPLYRAQATKEKGVVQLLRAAGAKK